MTVIKNTNTVSDMLRTAGEFRLKDRWSAITHLIGFLASIVAMPLLMLRGYLWQNSTAAMVSYMIYMLSMILLYGASASYHSFNISEKANLILKNRTNECSFFFWRLSGALPLSASSSSCSS